MNDAVRPPSPWTAIRAEYGPLCPTLRVIDVQAGTDEFRALQALPELGELTLDGCTLIVGLEQGIEWEERQALIARADEAFWRRRAEAETRRRR
jgi:hypothetical protein